ncbi:MAG TPA: hypothetical protein VHC43_11335, partial [Mycobacteriales bacterium]|nr:hypothetical protein [Mycobacteriales bacterium]
MSLAEPSRPASAGEQLAAAEAASSQPAQVWQRRYLSVLVGVDLVMILASTLVAFVVRFGDTDSSVRGISYVALSF